MLCADVCALVLLLALFFFFKQKTAYEMRISDWSSDVCSSDLNRCPFKPSEQAATAIALAEAHGAPIGLSENGSAVIPLSRVLEHAGRKTLLSQITPILDPHALAQQQIGRASCRERVCQYG